MVALPVVPQTCRVKLGGIINSAPWAAIQHLRYIGNPPSSSSLVSAATDVADAFADHMAATMGPHVVLRSVELWDLASYSGSYGNASVNTPGTLAITAPLPNSAAAVASWKVNYRWRGGHPRTYWPAGGANSLQNGNTWTASALGAFDAANQSYLSRMNTVQINTASANMVCVKYYLNKELLPVPLVLDIIGVDVDSRLDSQRRRLGPDVSA